MQLVHALAAGVRGAENGRAYVYNRGGSAQVAYYLGDGGFEGNNQQTAGTPVALDSNGGASVYVTQLALVMVRDVNGVEVRRFVVGNYDANVEVISPSFTGTDYDTAVSAANKPTTLEAVLDAVFASFGTTDWQVLEGGVSANLKDIITSLGGYLLSVKNYGAVGDGVADDATAIGQCIAAAATSGKVVLFPPGTYRVTSTISLPLGVSMLGCGPAKSLIRMDHASSNMFTHTGVATEFQSIRGLAFGALQSYTGSLFTTTVACLVQFECCRFGDAFTLGVLASGYFHTATDGISPTWQCSDCDFIFPVNRAGLLATRVASTAQIILKLIGCRLDWAELAANPPLALTYRLTMVGCTLDVSAMSLASDGGFASDFIVAVGNFVTNNGGGASFPTTILNGSGAHIFEAGNRVGDGVILVSNGPSVASLSSRVGKAGALSQSGGGTINLASEDYAEGIFENSVVVLTITDANAFTLSATVLDGLEFDLLVVNNAGGATGTITWSTSHFAGLTSVSGTVVPTSIAAVGSIISCKFRGCTGPDGLRYYPVGGAVVAT